MSHSKQIFEEQKEREVQQANLKFEEEYFEDYHFEMFREEAQKREQRVSKY